MPLGETGPSLLPSSNGDRSSWHNDGDVGDCSMRQFMKNSSGVMAMVINSWGSLWRYGFWLAHEFSDEWTFSVPVCDASKKGIDDDSNVTWMMETKASYNSNVS